MKINSLKIKNFRSYKGIVEFDFTPLGDRNIILIGGENGAGKSSIFEAMKICLYGPLNYKYQGIVPNYISKIKSMINEDVFTTEKVESFVEMTIELNSNGTREEYKINRNWEIIDNKLNEKLEISKNEIILNADEKIEFENYFSSILPPTVFELSFFDGEKMLDFFADNTIKDKLKDIILKLNNFDIFSELSRELELNSRRINREKNNLKDQIIEFEEREVLLNKNKEELNNIKLNIECIIQEIDNDKIELVNKENEFIDAGGLKFEEREKLISNISKLEEERDQINLKIKEFSNERLPFLILMDNLIRLKKEILMEEEFQAYEVVKDKLNLNLIYKILKDNLEKISEKEVGNISEKINLIVKPEFIDDEYKSIHNLSRDQVNKIIAIIDEIINININDHKYFTNIQEISSGISLLKNKLRASLDRSEEERYTKEIGELNNKINYKLLELEKIKLSKEAIEKQIEIDLSKIAKLNEKIELIKKNENIKDISMDIRKMTDILLGKLTDSKKKKTVNKFNEIFGEIIRKEKFIDYIDISEDFKLTLYYKKIYSSGELIRLLINLGIPETRKKLGEKFLEELTDVVGNDNRNSIISFLRENSTKEFKLSTKVDVMNLSSGEKQIYILCLYWALIKSSDMNLPFIIDTPYGRIDDEHRKSMTKKYMPTISEQVIILSTNTEIEEGLYEDIKNYLAKEYMLEYLIDKRCTKVSKGYFYEVI